MRVASTDRETHTLQIHRDRDTQIAPTHLLLLTEGGFLSLPLLLPPCGLLHLVEGEVDKRTCYNATQQ